jgi:hypothetical protein
MLETAAPLLRDDFNICWHPRLFIKTFGVRHQSTTPQMSPLITYQRVPRREKLTSFEVIRHISHISISFATADS